MADVADKLLAGLSGFAEKMLGELRALREDLYNTAALANPGALAVAYPVENRVTYVAGDYQPQASTTGVKPLCKADSHAPVLAIVHASLNTSSEPPNPLAFESAVLLLSLQGVGDTTPTQAAVIHVAPGAPIGVLVPPGQTLHGSVMASVNLHSIVVSVRTVKLQGKKTFRFES